VKIGWQLKVFREQEELLLFLLTNCTIFTGVLLNLMFFSSDNLDELLE